MLQNLKKILFGIHILMSFRYLMISVYYFTLFWFGWKVPSITEYPERKIDVSFCILSGEKLPTFGKSFA